MKQFELTPKQQDDNIEAFQKAMGMMESDLRNKVEKKLLDGDIGDQYFTAPASAKLDYHSCFVGGLLHHSLLVTRNLIKLDKIFPVGVEQQWLVFAGLFHDLGKCGQVVVTDEAMFEPYYLPCESEWHKEKMGKYYEYNSNLPYMVTAHRTLYLIQRAGISLPFDVFQALMIHDGPIAEGNRSYVFKEQKLSTLLHYADYLAVQEEKENWRSIQS